MEDTPFQAFNGDYCLMKKGSSVILDFGREINGTIRIVTKLIEFLDCEGAKRGNIHIRFGESVSETMADLGEKNAGNYHTPRDFMLPVSSFGTVEYGELGFRFVKIDVEDDINFYVQKVYAVYIHDKQPLLGKFECDDEVLNNIWQAGAYTAHLCVQDYIYDGIKRDRLVWSGELHPITSTLLSVYGAIPAIKRTLDFAYRYTHIGRWMNGMATYSMWWMIVQYNLYIHSGDVEYLKEQRGKFKRIIDNVIEWIDNDYGMFEDMSDYERRVFRFVDWSSRDCELDEGEGIKSVLLIGLNCALRMFEFLDEKEYERKVKEYSEKLKADKSAEGVNKRISGLNVLAERNTEFDYSNLVGKSAREMSSFMGYYVLLTKAQLDQTAEAIDIIKKYWGAMLQMGATTFWEDFDIDWVENSFRIDELPENGKNDIHGDFGKHCYMKFRHSLCHGWASGPTAFLMNQIGGIKILEPGCKKLKISPKLCNLKWFNIEYPTPYGVVKVSAKNEEGNISFTVDAPKEIEIVS